MDDYTWKKKLRERQARARRERALFLLFLVVSLGVLLWYFAFYTRTPEYAVKQLEQAIEEQDVQTFREFTALDPLLSDAYDDLTIDLFRHDDSLTPQTKILFEKFYVLVKPQLTGSAVDIICHKISTGTWTLPKGTDILKGRQLGIDYEEFLEKSLIKSTHLKEIGKVTHSDDKAALTLEVIEEYSQTPFTLELTLEKNEENRWQITCIKNYRSYLESVYPRLYRDIAQYIETSKDIVAQANADLQAQQWDVQYMGYSRSGQLTKEQRMQLAAYLEDHVIPTVRKRQEKLDHIQVPPGAAHLAELRRESSDLSIRLWQHYIHGLRENNIAEFNTAETLHKQMLSTEQRIEDIIRHTAVSKELPDMP